MATITAFEFKPGGLVLTQDGPLPEVFLPFGSVVSKKGSNSVVIRDLNNEDYLFTVGEVTTPPSLTTQDLLFDAIVDGYGASGTAPAVPTSVEISAVPLAAQHAVYTDTTGTFPAGAVDVVFKNVHGTEPCTLDLNPTPITLNPGDERGFSATYPYTLLAIDWDATDSSLEIISLIID